MGTLLINCGVAPNQHHAPNTKENVAVQHNMQQRIGSNICMSRFVLASFIESPYREREKRVGGIVSLLPPAGDSRLLRSLRFVLLECRGVDCGTQDDLVVRLTTQ